MFVDGSGAGPAKWSLFINFKFRTDYSIKVIYIQKMSDNLNIIQAWLTSEMETLNLTKF